MSEAKDSNSRTIALYVSAAASTLLAAALIYFTISLLNITQQIPDILKTIEATSEKIDPVVDEVAAVTEIIPSILEEVAQTRELLKPAIVEYARTNAQIPLILEEVKATRETLPGTLKTVDHVSESVRIMSTEIKRTRAWMPKTLKEVEATRKSIPPILAEVKATRELLPPMMDRADQLVANARIAGKEASQGAVTGIFSGILMAPFSFVGDVGHALVGEDEDERLVEKDFDLVELAARELLNSGTLNETRPWNNDESGNFGSVKLTSIGEDAEEDEECRELTIIVRNESEVIKNNTINLCREIDGKWEFN